MTTRRISSVLVTLLACACSRGEIAEPQPAGEERGIDSFQAVLGDRYTRYGSQGQWTVGAGALTATGPAEHELLIRSGAAFADGWVETVSKQSDDGGLVLRFADSRNYYLLGFRDDAAPFPRGSRNIQLYRAVNDGFREVGTADVAWPRGAVRRVRFEAEGAVLRAYLDGELVASWTDPFPLGTGGFGVRHYGMNATWATRFELFRWREILR
jgi:hypothetical protein